MSRRTPHLHHLLPVLAVAVAVAAIGWRALDPGDGPATPAPVEAAARPDSPSALPDGAARPRPPEPAAAETSPAPAEAPAPEAAWEPERIVIDRPIGELDPETRAALEARLARERAAEARFEEGVERSQVRARDIDTRVREAFRRVQLEPELLDGGMIRGLRIREVEGGSPFHEAGFSAGDLLVSLDERPLRDPAELPDLLASAGPVLSVCAERGATEFCRELVLR